MNKFIQGFITVAMLLSLVACSNAVPSLEVPERTEDHSLPVTSEPTMTALHYEGLDVNPQKLMLGYDVTDDAAFVSEVYCILDFENRKVCDGPSTAEVSIKLTFSDSDGISFFELDPNELAWTLSNGIPVEYFTLPNGSYSKISMLLTDYTSEHFLPDVGIDTLSEMVQECDIFTFYGDDSYFKADAEAMADFPNDLILEGWSEFTPPDGEHMGRRFSIADEAYIYDVLFLIDMQQVCVSKQGISTWYELTQQATEAIWLWYEDMMAVYSM